MGLHVKWAFALVFMCGCNQVFGLDPPGAENADARDHDARIVDAAGDRDMDGVLDDVDLCPDAADPLQLDEDGDGRGDRCDLCPHLNQNDDVDQDEDNVPDACDPLPVVGGGRLRFLGLHSSDEAPQVRTTGPGTVTWENDGVTLTPDLDSEMRMTMVEVDNQQHQTRVYAGVDIGTPVAGTVARRAVGVITELDPLAAGSTFFVCQLETDLPVTQLRLATYRIDAGVATPLVAAAIGSAWPAGASDLSVELAGDAKNGFTLGCETRGVGGSHLIVPSPTTELAPGESGVRAYGVPLHVRWLVVIDHP